MSESRCPFCGMILNEHPAGRCMDAWVAVVRGQEVIRSEDLPGDIKQIGEFFYYVWLGDAYERVHPYSALWEFAGELLDEMGAANLRAQVQTPGNGCLRWRVEFWGKGLRLRLFLAEAGPHAIARAFIAWKGES